MMKPTHILKDEVNVFVVVCSVHVQQSDDVGVVAKVLEEHDFPEGPLSVRLVPESVCITQKKCPHFQKKRE